MANQRCQNLVRSDDEKTDSIDAAFDSLVSLGDSCIQEGYQSGVAVSRAKGGREGLALGLNRGWDIGQEVGQIKAFAEFHLKLAGSSADDESVAKRNKLNRILTRISEAEIPFENPRTPEEGERLEIALSDLRSKQKQCQTMLAALQTSKTEPTQQVTTTKSLDW